MKTEKNLSRYKRGLKGRIDMVINSILENKLYTLMLVECKAEYVELTDTVFKQADNYRKKANVPIIMITNCVNAGIYVWNKNEDKV